MKNSIRSIALICVITLIISCDKETPKLDPRKTILGKWELTHYGNGTNLTSNDTPIVYQEYLLDSVLRYYSYEKKRFINYEKYWFEDSLLIQSFETFDDINNEIIVRKRPYLYEFKTADELRLEFQFSAQITSSIYTRID